MKLGKRLKMKKGPTASIAMKRGEDWAWRTPGFLFFLLPLSLLPFQIQFFLPFATDTSSIGGKNPVVALGRDINSPFLILTPSVCRSSPSTTWYWHENRGRGLGLDKMLQRKVASAIQQQRLLIWDLQWQKK